MSFALKLLGGMTLEGEQGPLTGPAVQRHRLALLAVLAASRPRAVSRDKLMAWLWPGRDGENARQLLNQSVHALRQALGAEAILSAGNELQFNPSVLQCDLVAFEEALTAGERERAVALYAGPFLDGFFLSEAPEFERWVDRERDRLAAACAKALDGLADRAEQAGDLSTAVEWRKARAAQDPYDSRSALRLMQALERSGNRAGALQHGLQHQQLLRDDLEIEANAEVLSLLERLRREPVVVPAFRRQSAPSPAMAQESEIEREAPAPPELLVPQTRAYLYGGLAILLVGTIWGVTRLIRRNEATSVAPAVVDEIAQAVARQLARREGGDTAHVLPRHLTRSIPAYELYLLGNDPKLLRSDSTARQGLEYFRQAVALDSNYAAAWAGVARMTLRQARSLPGGRKQAMREAEVALRKALSLDDSVADAHGTFALLRGNQHDLAGAELHFRRAIALDPGQARNHEWLVRLYVWMGRRAEALQEGRRAVAVEPLSPSASAELARALLVNGQVDAALAQLERIAGLQPPLLRAAAIAAQCYAWQQRWSEAIAQLRPSSDQAMPSGLYGYLLARAGQSAEAQRALDRLREGHNSLDIALVYTGMGNVGEMVRWMNRAIDDMSLIPFTEEAPIISQVLDSLRRHPGVAALRIRLGLQNR